MRDGKISERIAWVGAVDWDRRLFDNLIPLPDGTTYNSWLVRGSEKTALVDTADPTMTSELFMRLDQEKVEKIDFVVANHAEQDHTGSIPAVLERFPGATVLCTEKCRGMLLDLLPIKPENIKAVADGGEVSLGDRTLAFVHFPWVHWPETMLTWIPEERTLLPCDLFGSHMSQSSLFVRDEAALLNSAKRYYAEIMMPFRAIIEKNLPKVTSLDPAFIGPSHGPAYNKPSLILDAYKEWLSPVPKNLVTLAYVSMHDSTRLMTRRLVDALSARGVRVEEFDLTETEPGKLAISLVDAATILIGTPTVLGAAHPKAAYAAFLANALRPKAKHLAVYGSYGWGGKAVDQLASMVPNLKVEVIPPLLIKGVPRETDMAAIENLADEIRKRHEGLN